MAKRMADPEFRAEQHAGVHLPHVAELNDLVDSLRQSHPWAAHGFVPHIAPIHGGSYAKVLVVLRDPGKRTHATESGMLCIENNDETAATMCRLLEHAGLGARDITPWNAYPWFREDQTTGLSPTIREQGIEPLRRVLEVLPLLEVVVLHGNEAKDTWKRFARDNPQKAAGLEIVETYHPGRQALRARTPIESQTRVEHRLAAYRSVRSILDRNETLRLASKMSGPAKPDEPSSTAAPESYEVKDDLETDDSRPDAPRVRADFRALRAAKAPLRTAVSGLAAAGRRAMQAAQRGCR